MNRRNFLQNSGLSLAAITVSQQKVLSAFFQENWKINMLTDTVGTFTERGGTIGFLLSKDGIVVMDAQFPEQAGHLIQELKKKTEKPFQLLINTHHHGDHTAGNIAFKGLVSYVVAHENSKTNQQNVARNQKSEDKQLYPDQTYSDTWCQDFGREKICLNYYGAGHTNGDSVVHLQHANIVHMGDLVFNRRHPYVDNSAGADTKSWIKVLDQSIAKFDKKTVFIFGHSGEGYDITGKKEDLIAFRDYLGNVVQYVENGIRDGKSKEEILKATAIPGSPEWKGEGIQRPLGATYDQLAG
ncbi:MAG: MBL fold metallo-hydrolase [Terrimonas sp.]|nr:MBL fold metallo-hydrolase [Terrimonas sp.]